jgi:ankyrin repeat protein
VSTLDNLRREAKRWLRALRAGEASARERMRRAYSAAPQDPTLRDVQHALARELGENDWVALKESIARRAAEQPRAETTLEKYERVARDLVVAVNSGDASAMRRLMDHFGREVSWAELRDGAAAQLRSLPAGDVPEGPFDLPHAQLLIARQSKFRTWTELTGVLRGTAPLSGGRTPIVPYTPEIAPGMIMPVEVAADLPVRLRDGSRTSMQEIWRMLNACRNGDLRAVRDLAAKNAALVLCDHNYMTPLHLAVREGHYDIVHFLAERGGANPNYVTYPYREPLTTIARDRGYEAIAELLERWYAREDRSRKEEEGGEIEDGRDEERIRFQQLVNHDALPEAEQMLRDRPELALDPFASWFEGILSMPANRGNRPMLELLLQYGAAVPDVTKWGAWYYFKRYDIAAFLIERGMNPRHMNVHHTTLLHDMAYTGDVKKAELLLDAGAAIDAVDEEFRSTPLGLAARFGQKEVVELLLARGADPNRAAAAWAAPIEWARRKGHPEIERLLRRAGARDDGHRPSSALGARTATDVPALVKQALDRADADAFARLVHEHHDVFQEQWPYWLELDPASIVARAQTTRWLPVRPDIGAIEREVESEGGGDDARARVARSYGAESWDRLVLACRLIDAIWRDDIDSVRQIVTTHRHLLYEDAGVRHSNWGPPMAYAANLGRDRIIRMLHELGAKDFQWALDRAILQGQLDTARMLYEMGARPRPDTVEGPAETLNAQGMALLLDLGVHLTAESAPVAMVLETYSRNPSGKHQILELFVRHGIALPDSAPMAVHRGRIDLLEAHLHRDPALFSRTFAHEEIFPPSFGCHADHSLALHGTPLDGTGLLHMCVEYGEIEVARWMLDRGADVNLRARVDADGFGGHTALFNCVVSVGGGRRRSEAFAELLLHRGADPSVRASLRKQLPFTDDTSLHEYRDVTAVEWGQRFHDRSFVNEAAVDAIARRSRPRP